jgi:hypothetical protein
LCVFGVFKILYKREDKVKGLKGETLKIYRALAAFYKSTIIPTVRWSFLPAGFQLRPDNLFAPVTLHPEIFIKRISLPEISLQEYVEPGTLGPPPGTDRAACKQSKIPHDMSLLGVDRPMANEEVVRIPSVAITKKKTRSKRKNPGPSQS